MSAVYYVAQCEAPSPGQSYRYSSLWETKPFAGCVEVRS